MKQIALAIMVVGLCIYLALRRKWNIDEDCEGDWMASLFAFIGAVELLLS